MPYGGTFAVQPGITTAVPVALEMNLVNIEWSVTETTIKDVYEVNVSQTFATKVPAPVLVMEPPMVNVPYLAPGEVFNGELVLTNHGLVGSDLTGFKPPDVWAGYEFELLSPLPEKIGAEQSIRIAYRITRRPPPAQSAAWNILSEVAGYFGGEDLSLEEAYEECASHEDSTETSAEVTSQYIACPSSPNSREVTKTTVVKLIMTCARNIAGGEDDTPQDPAHYDPNKQAAYITVIVKVTKGVVISETTEPINLGDCEKCTTNEQGQGTISKLPDGECCPIKDNAVCKGGKCEPVSLNSVTALANEKDGGAVAVGATVKFEATLDAQNCVPEYIWTFEDGTKTSGASASSAFNETGPHTVSVEVGCKCSEDKKTDSVTVDVKEPELNIITPAPAPDNKIVLPTIKVKGEMVPNDPNAVIEWNTVIGGEKLTTQTASGVEGKMEMSKLPSLNSSFGDNKVIAKAVVNGEVIDEKEVTVVYYFPLEGTQNPSGLPNWYYYWSQTEVHCSDYMKYNGPQCNDNPTWGAYYDTGTYDFYICDRAKNSGIYYFGRACVHELTHLNIWWNLWPNGYDETKDSDRDRLPDSLEESLGGYKTGNRNTYNHIKWKTDYDHYTETMAYGVSDAWTPPAVVENWAEPQF